MAQLLLPVRHHDRGRVGQRIQFHRIPTRQEETEQPELLPGHTGAGRRRLPRHYLHRMDQPL